VSVEQPAATAGRWRDTRDRQEDVCRAIVLLTRPDQLEDVQMLMQDMYRPGKPIDTYPAKRPYIPMLCRPSDPMAFPDPTALHHANFLINLQLQHMKESISMKRHEFADLNGLRVGPNQLTLMDFAMALVAPDQPDQLIFH
jgi:hypothetical protein